jgi:ABC-type uncharacterized transport system auxiliary subunit
MPRPIRPLRARAAAALLAFAAVLAGPSIAAASVFWLAHGCPVADELGP